MNLGMGIRYTILIGLLILTIIMSSCIGAVSMSALQVIDILAHLSGIDLNSGYTTIQENILLHIRLPRVVLGILIGAGLSISGAAMQGLFRNPLADPSLIGLSAGASFTASLVIVLGIGVGTAFATYSLTFFTFIGAALTAFLVYQLSKSNGQIVVTTMLLGGIAFNALGGAGTGFMTFLSDEAQLRDLTFWTLGSLGGASWKAVGGIAGFIIIPLLFSSSLAKGLNTLALGEVNASYLGVNIKYLKNTVVIIAALVVGATVSVAGIISFMGLVIPHVIRLIWGPDHKFLLPASALLGASVLVLADLISRTVVSPSELPIGIVTAMIGTPLFIMLLVRQKKKGAAYA